MKITFSNLGRIKKTTLDLRPLTVIVGENNTNKTYLAYSVCGLFEMSSSSLIQIFDRKPLNQIKFNKKSEKEYFFNFSKDEFVKKFNTEIDKRICKPFARQEIVDFFFSSESNFQKSDFWIDFSSREIFEPIGIPNTIRIMNGGYSVKFEYWGEPNCVKINILDENENVANLASEARHQIISEILSNFQSSLFNNLHRNVIPGVFILPTERDSLVLTYKILSDRRRRTALDIIRMENLGRVFERKSKLLELEGDVPYPKPIENLLNFLSDVELEKKPKVASEISFLASLIEASVQNKNKLYFKPSVLSSKSLHVKIEGSGIDIPLHLASSSIKQLAPLLLYLRYRARSGQLLIIDEPEMGLHPEAQVKLLEALAILVNLGVKVLITTHSPYFMAHLNNLLNDEADAKTLRRQASALYLKDSRAFLPANKISAYEMKDKGAEGCVLEDLHDPDYGIRWDTLSDVSVDIQQKYFEIAAKGRKSTNGKKR